MVLCFLFFFDKLMVLCLNCILCVYARCSSSMPILLTRVNTQSSCRNSSRQLVMTSETFIVHVLVGSVSFFQHTSPHTHTLNKYVCIGTLCTRRKKSPSSSQIQYIAADEQSIGTAHISLIYIYTCVRYVSLDQICNPYTYMRLYTCIHIFAYAFLSYYQGTLILLIIYIINIRM